jgi:drug/metabolite transporter (DMT)-like permease
MLGIVLTSVAETGIIISTFPVVTMIMASVFLREHPSKMQIVSIIVSVLGAAVVVFSQGILSPTFNPLGYLALFGAVISAGLFFVFSRGVTGYSNAAKSYVMMGMGFAAFTAAAAVEHARNGSVSEWLTLPFRDRSFLAAALYLGALTSVVGTWAQNFSIARLGVHRSSAFSGVSTVVGVLAGVLLLGEPFTLAQGCGMAMILLGVTGVNQFGRNYYGNKKRA